MAGFDPSPIRRLVELICTDPDLLLLTEDGRIVRPAQPVTFESLPHAEKVCQAAVRVIPAFDAGDPFYVSLCDVSVACDETVRQLGPALLARSAS